MKHTIDIPDVIVEVSVVAPSTGTMISQQVAGHADGDVTQAVSAAMNEARDLLIGQLGLVKRARRAGQEAKRDAG